MAKLKNLFSILFVLFIFGCNSTSNIIEKPYPVYIPGVHDTISLKADTVYLPSDSNASWSGNVEDSLHNVIGWLKVFYNRKIAELKLHPKIDTVKVKETITEYKDKPVQIISGLLDWWGEILLILFGVILLAIQNKNIDLLSYLKNLIVKK